VSNAALIQTVWSTAQSDASLSAAVSQTSDLTSGIYYNEAPETARMPYVVFHIIANETDHTFCYDFESTSVQFDVFSKKSSISEVSQISDKLMNVFDRAVLVYDNNDQIGCLRSSTMGPEKLKDGWRTIVGYEIQYS